jgi:hypothetical protein
VCVDQEIGQLAVHRIEPRVERRPILAIGVGKRGAIGFQSPYIIIDLRLGGQAGAVEHGAHTLDAVLPPGDFGIGCGLGNVGPPVSALLEAEPRCQLWLLLSVFVEFGIEERREPRILGSRRGSSGDGWRSKCIWRGKAGKRDQAGGDLQSHARSLFHDILHALWKAMAGQGNTSDGDIVTYETGLTQKTQSRPARPTTRLTNPVRSCHRPPVRRSGPCRLTAARV